jgi:hypothetical protein
LLEARRTIDFFENIISSGLPLVTTCCVTENVLPQPYKNISTSQF